jgi:hypothetical protein
LRDAEDGTPEALFALLKRADALRRGARFAELLVVLQLAEPGSSSGRAAQRLNRALAAAASIDAGAIAREAVAPLEIAVRIDAARLAAVRAALG